MRLMAVDFGDKRTGLAICDAAEMLATPYEVITTSNIDYCIQQIIRLAENEHVEGFVVGLPLHMDGSQHGRAFQTRQWGDRLVEQSGKPVYYADERLSSSAAERMFPAGVLTRKGKKKRLDAVAAAVILESFLEYKRQYLQKPKQPEHIQIFSQITAWAKAAADHFAQAARQAIAQRGIFSAALSGGKTPVMFFDALAELAGLTADDWRRIRLFWVDERFVPSDSPDSNFWLAREHLISKVPIPDENVFRIKTEKSDVSAVANDYQATLRTIFGIKEYEYPVFDWVGLGLGQDGHIASLLPGTLAVWITGRLTYAVRWQPRGLDRVTLTAPVLQNARQIVMLIHGQEKAAIVRAIFNQMPDPAVYPVFVLWPVLNKIVWLLDQPAASLIGGWS